MLKAILIAFLLLLSFSAEAGVKSDDPRTVVKSFFALLKAEKYSSLYEYLPGDMQKQMTREDFSKSLKPLRGFLSMETMEIGRVQQRGDFAVIDTTIFGKITPPAGKGGKGETRDGKITVQQYLFKENGKWKVATSTSQSRAYLMRKYPQFKEGFAFAPAHVFIRQDGQWMAFR